MGMNSKEEGGGQRCGGEDLGNNYDKGGSPIFWPPSKIQSKSVEDHTCCLSNRWMGGLIDKYINPEIDRSIVIHVVLPFRIWPIKHAQWHIHIRRLQQGNTFYIVVVSALVLRCSAAVFPSPPDFCSPLLLPECQLEATSSFSQTNLSGLNGLPLQPLLFLEREAVSRASSASLLTEISQEDTVLWGILSPPSVDFMFCFFSGCCLFSPINV